MSDINYLLNEIDKRDIKQYRRLHSKLVRNFGHLVNNVGTGAGTHEGLNNKSLEQSLVHVKVYTDENRTNVGLYSNVFVRFLNSVSNSPFKKAFILLVIISIFYIFGIDLNFIISILQSLSGITITPNGVLENLYMPYLSKGGI